MEYRSQKTTTRVLSFSIALVLSTTAWGQDLQFEVRHERALKDHPGVVTFDERGVQYQQVLTEKQQAKIGKGKKPPKLESARWEYQDIQQLWISPEKLVIVTYKDRKWFLGVDKEFEFFLPKGKSFEAAYGMLKDKLDRRFVAAVAESQPGTLWELPVKLLGRIYGSDGVLQVGPDRIVYKTDPVSRAPGGIRTSRTSARLIAISSRLRPTSAPKLTTAA
jgi:hypothetical protein